MFLSCYRPRFIMFSSHDTGRREAMAELTSDWVLLILLHSNLKLLLLETICSSPFGLSRVHTGFPILQSDDGLWVSGRGAPACPHPAPMTQPYESPGLFTVRPGQSCHKLRHTKTHDVRADSVAWATLSSGESLLSSVHS